MHSYLWGALHPYVWLVKADATGKMDWDQSYDYVYYAAWNQSYDHLFNAAGLVQTSDGGLAFAGNAQQKVWLVKLDASGNAEWNQTYPNRSGGGDGWTTYRLIETSDGGFALAGSWKHTSSVNYYFLVKTEPTLPPPTPTPAGEEEGLLPRPAPRGRTTVDRSP